MEKMAWIVNPFDLITEDDEVGQRVPSPSETSQPTPQPSHEYITEFGGENGDEEFILF